MASHIYEELSRRIREAHEMYSRKLAAMAPKRDPNGCKTCGLVDCHPLCASKLNDNEEK